MVSNAAVQIGWGLAAGVGAGLAGALLFRAADKRAWIGSEWRQIVPLAAALLAYALAVTLGGSGFIAAFVGGMVFGIASGVPGSAVTLFTEETGGLLAAVTWIGFGALALGLVIPHVTWQVVLYAVLSLTLVRMVPVAIALLGKGVQRPTMAFIGWFGPRGLASVVFALLVLERGVPEGRDSAHHRGCHRGAERSAARPHIGALRAPLSPLVRRACGGAPGRMPRLRQ